MYELIIKKAVERIADSDDESVDLQLACEVFIAYGGKKYYVDLSGTNIGCGVYVNGNRSMSSENKKYIVLGVHDSKPGCYKYLERLYVFNKETKVGKLVSFWKYIGDGNHYDFGSKLQRIWNEDGQIFAGSNCHERVIVNCDQIFLEPIDEATLPYYPEDSEIDFSDLSTYFKYIMTNDMDVIMTLKPEVPIFKLLMFKGFTLSYDTFKLSLNKSGYGRLLFVNTTTRASWEIEWGVSTTCITNSVKDVKNQIIACVKKKFPNLPFFLTKDFGTVLD